MSTCSFHADPLPRPPPNSVPLRGVFKNYNTIEEFKATETKKELFDAVVDRVCLQPFLAGRALIHN